MARICVIDDDAQLLRMVGMMLQRGGHEPTLVSNPAEGLETLRRERPDLLLLDVMMPHINGHDLTRQIRATKGLEDLPILVMTARSQEVDRLTALNSGADDYVSKPVSFQLLMERVDGLLRQERPFSGSKRGQLLAFFGLRGGQGQTTLAVNTAAALRRVSQEEVCLVDFGPVGSQALIHLRLQASPSWVEQAVLGELDWAALLSCMRVHESGLRLLPVSTPQQTPLLPTAEAVLQLLAVLQEQMAFTVLDLPPILNPAFRAALTGADTAFQLVTSDVVSVQTAVQLNEALAQAQAVPRQRLYVLNQVTPEEQLPQTAVERGLGSRLTFQVPYDANQKLALMQGVPLALSSQSSSPIARFALKLAQALWQHARQKGQA